MSTRCRVAGVGSVSEAQYIVPCDSVTLYTVDLFLYFCCHWRYDRRQLPPGQSSEDCLADYLSEVAFCSN